LTALVYVDASALVKLAIAEAESAATRLYLTGDVNIVASRIALIEAIRAARHGDIERTPRWEDIVAVLSVRDVDESIANVAATFEPANLRTLDAIHLATALELRAELDAFVTYDGRLAEAARGHRLPVVSPA
jgi:uncharacterized protein